MNAVWTPESSPLVIWAIKGPYVSPQSWWLVGRSHMFSGFSAETFTVSPSLSWLTPHISIPPLCPESEPFAPVPVMDWRGSRCMLCSRKSTRSSRRWLHYLHLEPMLIKCLWQYFILLSQPCGGQCPSRVSSLKDHIFCPFSDSLFFLPDAGGAALHDILSKNLSSKKNPACLVKKIIIKISPPELKVS